MSRLTLSHLLICGHRQQAPVSTHQVLVDTLLDDPNQRRSGGVTMLMNAANTGQRRMGTNTDTKETL